MNVAGVAGVRLASATAASHRVLRPAPRLLDADTVVSDNVAGAAVWHLRGLDDSD